MCIFSDMTGLFSLGYLPAIIISMERSLNTGPLARSVVPWLGRRDIRKSLG